MNRIRARHVDESFRGAYTSRDRGRLSGIMRNLSELNHRNVRDHVKPLPARPIRELQPRSSDIEDDKIMFVSWDCALVPASH